MEEKIIILIQKFLKGEITREEMSQLQSYYDNSFISENSLERYYNQKWLEAENLIADKDVHDAKEDAWEKIKSQFDYENKVSPVRRLFGFKWLQVVAAVALLVLMSGTVYWFFDASGNYSKGKGTTITVENGQKSKVELPDGTIAYLNSSSTITCLPDYGRKNRIVRLSGEAYFQVKSNPHKPFIVNTLDGISVRALGTKFNVKSYVNENTITSSLIEGKIVVQKDNESYTLKPNETISYNKTTNQFVKKQEQDPEEFIAWRNNQFFLQDETLESISKMLERTYNIKFIFETEDIKNIRYSGKVSNTSLENILTMITIATPLEYVSQDSVVILIKSK